MQSQNQKLLPNSNSTPHITTTKNSLVVQQNNNSQQIIRQQFPMYNQRMPSNRYRSPQQPSNLLMAPPIIPQPIVLNTWQQDLQQYRANTLVKSQQPVVVKQDSQVYSPTASSLFNPIQIGSPLQPSSVTPTALNAYPYTAFANQLNLPHANSRSLENASGWQTQPLKSDKFPLLKQNRKRGKGSNNVEGVGFGSKSLKNIINDIEAVEENDIIRKKTKRRFPAPPVPLSQTDPPSVETEDRHKQRQPLTLASIKAFQVEAFDDESSKVLTHRGIKQIQSDGGNFIENQQQSDASTPHKNTLPSESNSPDSTQKKQKDFQIKVHNMKNNLDRVIANATQQASRNDFEGQLRKGRSRGSRLVEMVEELKVSHQESAIFFKKLADILYISHKSRIISELVKISSKYRLKLADLKKPEPNIAVDDVEEQSSQILEVSFVSKDFYQHNNHSFEQKQDFNAIDSQDMEISISPQKPKNTPHLPDSNEETEQKSIIYYPYNEVVIGEDFQYIQGIYGGIQSHSYQFLKIARNYIPYQLIKPSIVDYRPISNKPQQVIRPALQQTNDFVDCEPAPNYFASELINLENIGLSYVRLRLLRTDQDQLFALQIEQKPSNRLTGQLQMGKEDLKVLFRDIIMTTNLDRLKKGQVKNEQSRDYFMIERISRLLVSTSETVDRFISKEIMLKLLKPMFASNIVISKHQIGSKLAIIAQNDKLKSQLARTEQGKQTSYQDLLQETNIIGKQSSASILKKTSLNTDSIQILITKTVAIKRGLFFIITVQFHKLQNQWSLILYQPQSQKTFKVNFSFKMLIKIFNLFKITSKANEDATISPNNLLGVSGIEQLEITQDKSHLSNTRKKIRKKGAKVITQNNLRMFDKITGAFQDKDVSADFSINKTQLFLLNNGNFNNSAHQNSILKAANNNNLRYMDPDQDSSVNQSSQRRNSNQFIPDAYKTPQKIVLAKRGIGAKRVQERSRNRGQKDKMFNNSYLNCYFQINEQTKKKQQLDQTNMSFGDSIKTKDENESAFSLSHENVFNMPQKLPFWKKLLQSLSFADTSDQVQDMEEETQKAFKLMIRIQSEGKCFSRKMHQIVFDQEVEQYKDSFNLVHYQVSLEYFNREIDNPYGGSGTVQFIKNPQVTIDPNDYLVNVKQFDVSQGSWTKSKFPLKSILKASKNSVVSLSDAIDAIKQQIYDQKYHQGQDNINKFVNQEDFEYVPKVSRLVMGIIKEASSKILVKQNFNIQDIQRARDDFMRWKRLKTQNEVSPAYEKIVSTLISQNDAKHLVRLRLQMFYTLKSVVIRLYDPQLLFKKEQTIYFQEIQERFSIPKQLLIQAAMQSPKKYLVTISERILSCLETEILDQFQSRFYKQQEPKSVTTKKERTTPNALKEEGKIQFVNHTYGQQQQSNLKPPQPFNPYQVVSGTTFMTNMESTIAHPFFTNAIGSSSIPSHLIGFNGSSSNLFVVSPAPNETSITRISKRLRKKLLRTAQIPLQDNDLESEVAGGMNNGSRIFVGKKKKKKKKKLKVIPRKDIEFGTIQERTHTYAIEHDEQ